MRTTAIRLSAVTMALLLATACSSPPTGAPRSSTAAAAAPTASAACLREGEACQRAGASCCRGMLCVGGDAGACMPAN
jgi:hypothetical protein